MKETTKLLNAWTPTDYSGLFPEYINVLQINDEIQISIRAGIKKDGSPGDFLMLRVNNWTLHKIGQLLIEASNNYECGLGNKS